MNDLRTYISINYCAKNEVQHKKKKAMEYQVDIRKLFGGRDLAGNYDLLISSPIWDMLKKNSTFSYHYRNHPKLAWYLF